MRRSKLKYLTKNSFSSILVAKPNSLYMKKSVLLAILMVVCANGMFAQTEDISDSTDIVSSESTANSESIVDRLSKEDMLELLKAFHEIALESQSDTTDILTEVPVRGSKKFLRRNYITQRLELSIIGGSDNDGTGKSESITSTYKTKDDVDDARSNGSNFNYGLNIGYSVSIVPGKIRGDTLKLNRFGLGYSFGLLASFDRQEYYGTTCDILLKVGGEAGSGHKLGIGIDALVGSGKTAGEYEFEVKDANDNVSNAALPYTRWCFKYGAQLWIRSNLLNVPAKNTDVRLFVRFVHSVNPESPEMLKNNDIICNKWMGESWSFGLTFCHTF